MTRCVHLICRTFLFLITFSIIVNGQPEAECLSVVVLFRHGDRTPEETYPLDPYGDESLWQVDFGQLTATGKQQHYTLGQWFRQRWSSFLPNKYSERDIYVQATDVDRTIMSALSNLAGLYPPKDDQVWAENIPWQPIPVHTTPRSQDSFLYMGAPCPKYDRLYTELLINEEFSFINKKNQDLYQYLSNNTGWNITTFLQVGTVYDILYIEDTHNLTLPAWSLEVYPEQLEPLAELSFSSQSYTKDLARLQTGPIVHRIIEHFAAAAARNNKTEPKFLMLSAHDSTVVNLLSNLNVYDHKIPPYTATVILELLRNENGSIFVNLNYKKAAELKQLVLPNCDYDCGYEEFVEILQQSAASPAVWDKECQEGSTRMN